jgi:hypothetical protein
MMYYVDIHLIATAFQLWELGYSSVSVILIFV